MGKGKEQINRAVARLRALYEATGRPPFQNFFCPILLEDTGAELCRGHIVPDSAGGTIWTPQVKHLDGFYGRVAESDFAVITQYCGQSLLNLWANPDAREVFDPQFRIDGQTLPSYSPQRKAKVPPNHIAGRLQGDVNLGDIELCDIAFKIDVSELERLEGGQLELAMEKDFRPAIAATVLKTAHLTMFRLFGYQYVFSPAGLHLSSILKEFYIRYGHKEDDSEAIAALPEYFGQFMWMIRRMQGAGNLEGTIRDKKILALWDSHDRPYAAGVVVRAFDEINVVLLPAADRTIDTYYGLRDYSPPSVKVRECIFSEEKWLCSKDFRLPFAASAS